MHFAIEKWISALNTRNNLAPIWLICFSANSYCYTTVSTKMTKLYPQRKKTCNVGKSTLITHDGDAPKQVSGRAEQKWDDFSGSSKFIMVRVCQSFVGHWVTGKVSSGGGWLPWTWIVACLPEWDPPVKTAAREAARCTRVLGVRKRPARSRRRCHGREPSLAFEHAAY